jgi:S-adenosylmethionine synthetase
MPKTHQLKVSESVCAGHPDKLADQISDAILDSALEQDKNARVACETLVANNLVILAGEITTKAKLDYETIARQVISDNGYTFPKWGFSDKSVVKLALHHQSPEIAIGVGDDDSGAGDQGLMYGYACNETENFMPLAITIAHDLVKSIDNVRVNNIVPFLRPDGKSQVVVRYENDLPVAIEHITIAVPHDESVKLSVVRSEILKEVIKPVAEKFSLDVPANIIVNGTGVWHNPGPSSDVGLTGRKIIVDTYGGAAKAGGGAFSGKDPSKVDRSGAYAARYIAKNIVAHGLADKAEVCLAYYIGAKETLVKDIETFGTAKVPAEQIKTFADKLIDCSVKGIIESLDLKRPIYSETAIYGHFGKANLPWEKIVK